MGLAVHVYRTRIRTTLRMIAYAQREREEAISEQTLFFFKWSFLHR